MKFYKTRLWKPFSQKEFFFLMLWDRTPHFTRTDIHLHLLEYIYLYSAGFHRFVHISFITWFISHFNLKNKVKMDSFFIFLCLLTDFVWIYAVITREIQNSLCKKTTRILILALFSVQISVQMSTYLIRNVHFAYWKPVIQKIIVLV